MPRSHRSAVACALVLSLVACGADAPPPNILVISVDTLRADHLGCYGYERATSPAIDGLAAQGTRFADMTSSTSWTLPAHAALFTGLPDSVHGADSNTKVLSPGHVTLAETLADAGYDTAGFWSGPYLHPRFGIAQGFDHYESCASFEIFAAKEIEADVAARAEDGAAKPPTGQFRADKLSHSDITSPRIVERVEAWLRGRAGEGVAPFFLFVHFWDAHYDFIPPPPYDKRFDPDYEGKVHGRNLGVNPRLQKFGLPPRDLEHLVALYDGEIAWTDAHIGKVLGLLDSLGLDENTLVVLTADHGEEFFEHDKFGHRKTLYQEVLSVPLVVRWPGRVPTGHVVEETVRTVDVAPTVLDLAGLAPLEAVMGQSLVPLLSGRGAAPSPVIAELVRPWAKDELLALRSGSWKLLVRKADGEPMGLFDLARDPGEENDLWPTDERLRNEATAALTAARALLDELAEHHADARSGAEVGMPPELERQLRALGYMGNGEAK